ncbi:hypothetical protein C7N43_28700 [Sphingobacteriales bacterium UPWRP_1]|nr:hypothetical protein BVG80_13065 [Sphingobacteriales bacterium TSM_CSM]PSJ73516.1 hypothetical protein C7N43_28700 [Sphingobacteriales bacterium UPWRP_1]
MKILKVGLIIAGFFCLLLSFCFVIIPKQAAEQNNAELTRNTAEFNKMKHPAGTKSIYQKNYFGNLGGTGNSCSFANLQIRKYQPEITTETDIKSFYKKYPYIMVRFIKTLEDCCEYDINSYQLYCMGTYANNQPEITHENAGEILPVYTIEMIIEGGNTADWRCN